MQETEQTRARGAERQAIKLAEFAMSPGGIANARAAKKAASVRVLARRDVPLGGKWGYSPWPRENPRVLYGLVGSNNSRSSALAKSAERERTDKRARNAAAGAGAGDTPSKRGPGEIPAAVSPFTDRAARLLVGLAEAGRVEDGAVEIRAKSTVTPTSQERYDKKCLADKSRGFRGNYPSTSSRLFTTHERAWETRDTWTRGGGEGEGKPLQTVYRLGMTRLIFFITVGLLMFFFLLLIGLAVYLAMEGNGNNPETSAGLAVDLIVRGRAQGIH